MKQRKTGIKISLKKRCRRWLASSLLLMLAIPQVVGGTAAAAEQKSGAWKQDDNGYWFRFSDGTYAKSEWLKSRHKWYYFNESGYMLTGWQTVDGTRYYFLPEGAMATGWQKIYGNWYYFKSDGTLQTGWLGQKGKWYYFDTHGNMVTSQEVTIEGKKYIFDDTGELMFTYCSDITKAVAGDIVTFGKYEQDNDTSNGKEAIEWIVLEKKTDGSLFMVSRYALDSVQYDKNAKDMTWEMCQSREWLNGEFLNAAFSTAEQAKIQSTTLKNDDNPFTGTDGGNDTVDKVFYLSYTEVHKYFGESRMTDFGFMINPKLACKTTAYARAQGAYKMSFASDYYGPEMKQFADCCWWPLRTPGPTARRILYVNNMGDSGYASFYLHASGHGVRPACVVKP